MTSTQTDLIDGLTTSVAIKAPVRVATTANITLSGTQAIDGVALSVGDRVLVKDQTTPVENGIYCVGSAAWVRASDFDGARDVAKGTLFWVNEGSVSAATFYQLTTTGAISIGTSNLTFGKINGSFTGTFQHTGTGSVQRSIQEKLEDETAPADFGADVDGTSDDGPEIITALGSVNSLAFPNGSHAVGSQQTIPADKELTGYGIGSVIQLLETLANAEAAFLPGNNNRIQSLRFNIPAQSANTNQTRALQIMADDTAVMLCKFVSNREASYGLFAHQNVNRMLVLGNQFEVLANGPIWKPNFYAPTSETYQGSGFVAVANMMKGANAQGRIGISIDGNCVGAALVGNHAYNFQGEGPSQAFAYALANDGRDPNNLSGITIIGNVGQDTQDEVFHQEDECNGVIYIGNVAIDGSDAWFIINDTTVRNVSLIGNFGRDFVDRGIAIAGVGSSSNVNVIANMLENWGTGGAMEGLLIGQGASSHINVLANILDAGTGQGIAVQPNNQTNVAYNIIRGATQQGLVFNGPTESIYVESNNMLSGAAGGPVDESTVNGVSGDKDVYCRDITVGSAQTIVLGHFRRPAVITRLEMIYQAASDGTTAQTFDLGVNGDASLYAGASLKDGSPAAAAYDVDNFTTFVTRVVPAGSVLTLDLNAGSDSTFQVTCRVNYFEYS